MSLTENHFSWCRTALAIQNASNPSGVAHAIAETTSAMVAAGLSTQAICEHPALALMACKLLDLCGVNYDWPHVEEGRCIAVVESTACSATTEVTP